jgi:hypothetical protein
MMSKFIQIITSILIILGLMALSSCRYELSSGRNPSKTVTKNQSVKPFEQISVNGSMNVHYTQGKTIGVKIVGEENDIDKINVVSDGRTLNISRNHSVVFGIVGGSTIDIYVTSPDLIGVRFSGSGEFFANNHVDTDDMDISMEGSGAVNFADIVCDKIKAGVVGSGDVNIKNVMCGDASFVCVGSGDMDANVVKANTINLSLQGSGDIDLKAKDCVNVISELQGSGDITISGNVRNLEKNLMGSGDYHTHNLRVEK